MSQLGMGVMLNHLSGNANSVKAFKNAIGNKISKVSISESGDILNLYFEKDTGVRFRDEGQSCCEHRYMDTDDNLEDFVGAKLLDAEIREAPEQQDECGETHEVEFLDIKTDKGVFTISNHNEHNGYYGGFAIEVSSF